MPEAPDDPDQRLGGHDEPITWNDNPALYLDQQVRLLAKERDDYRHTLVATLSYVEDEEARLYIVAALKRWNHDPEEG